MWRLRLPNRTPIVRPTKGKGITSRQGTTTCCMLETSFVKINRYWGEDVLGHVKFPENRVLSASAENPSRMVPGDHLAAGSGK